EYSDIKIFFMNSHENPAQIGELLYQIIPAAYTQAVSQAVGITIDRLPLETDSLYNLLLAKQHKLDVEKLKMEQEILSEEKEAEE
ncbi:MAG: hypothetical protein J6Y16_06095, partial [Treponema sp.]|nr:hypothetical protein [Treponema sp.]